MIASNIPAWLQQTTSVPNQTEPSWFTDFREQQQAAFLQNGLPTRKQERWKYADLSFLTTKQFTLATRATEDELCDVVHQHRLQKGDSILLVFANGYFMPALSDMTKLPPQVIACSMHEAMQTQSELVQAHGMLTDHPTQLAFANLNAAVSTDGLFLHVPDNCEVPVALHLLFITVGNQEHISYPRHLFVMGEHSKLTLLEEHFSFAAHAYMLNAVTTVVVGKSAALTHYKIQQDGKQGVHIAHTFVYQQQDSTTSFLNFSLGAQFARDDLVIKLQGAGADCKTGGFYRLHADNQYIDHHVDIEHQAPRSSSEMVYKGVLDNRSRAVFNGRLHVNQGAEKTLAHQANHNLLLSNTAEVYSKPELEIYADDVKCKHGATIGQLDQEALFYLCSRGIARDEAVAMLLQGFADEIARRVTHAGIKLRVQEVML